MLAGITGLIAAIGGTIGSVASLIGILFVVRRSSPRERREAAEQVSNIILPPKQIESTQVLDELAERRSGDDRDATADGPTEGR